MKLLGLPVGCLTVCFVTEGSIARWNRAYRGKDRSTDVLSFPAGDEGDPSNPNNKRDKRKGAKAAYLGDIAIAPLVARRNAIRYGRTSDDEMRILILHGILHLMGYDHETDRGQMERRERRLRRMLGVA
jgi:probable rRNA maturation factor